MRIVLPQESFLLQFVWGHTTTLLDYVVITEHEEPSVFLQSTPRPPNGRPLRIPPPESIEEIPRL